MVIKQNELFGHRCHADETTVTAAQCRAMNGIPKKNAPCGARWHELVLTLNL
jgi:hypothetical protein